MTALAYLPDTGDLIWTDFDRPRVENRPAGARSSGLSPLRSLRTPAPFLVSEDAGFITGQTIHVNGGAHYY